MTAAGSGLIHADLSDRRMIRLAARRIDVMVDDAPNAGIVLADQSSDSQDGHDFGELDDEGLEQQGKVAAGSGPGDSDAMDAAQGAT